MSTARENKNPPAASPVAIVQSLLLLAAVIAGIVGLGWSLMKVAEFRASSKVVFEELGQPVLTLHRSAFPEKT
jgi:flagellar biogenesis protein FliO